MSTTTNMGITKWAGSDHFSYSQLATNWDKVDAHDHTSGKGVQIPTAGIANNAITSAKIADGAIVNADINASAAIDGTKLAAASIPVSKLSSWASGLYSARPAAGTFGSLYRATDLDVVYFDNGTSWAPVPGFGKVPFCRAAAASGTWNYATSTFTISLAATESYDEGTATQMHDPGSNPSRITIREAGLYEFQATVTISHPDRNTEESFLYAYFQKNGSGAFSDDSGGMFVANDTGGGLVITLQARSVERFAVNDYIECKLARTGVMGGGDDSIQGAYVTARYLGR